MFKRFKGWFKDTRARDPNFPDPDTFAKWQWEGENPSPTGPFLHTQNWWALATLTWAQERLHDNSFPRGDYREFCELLNIILGGEVNHCEQVFCEYALCR